MLNNKSDCFDNIPEVILGIAISIYIIIFSHITLLRHWTFYSAYFDLGCFEQGLWTTINGLFFWNSPHQLSQFGVHNSPIIFILLPIYQLFPYSETLIILQTILLASAAYPCYLIGKKIVNKWCGLTFGLIYLLYPALHGINLFDFHELSFLPLILFCAIYYLIQYKIYHFILLSLFALLIKEDVSILLIMITIYSIIYKKYNTPNQKKLLVSLIFIYVIWLIASLTIIIPYFNPHGYLFTSRYLFDGGVSALVLNNFALKIIYLILLIVPLGFTPLVAPEFLIISFPSFAEILLQHSIAYRITTQYSALLIPILFTSAIMGTKKIIDKLTKHYTKFVKYIFPILMILGMVSCIFCTPAPISPFTLYYQFSPNNCEYIIDDHINILHEAIDMIPQNASVSTQNNLGGHLSKRTQLYLDYLSGVEYILIDYKTSNVEWLGNKEISFPLDFYDKIFQKDGVVLYKIR